MPAALCSWCGRRTTHRLVERYVLRRNVHRCAKCGGRTIRCRLCSAMARGRDGYDEELCFLHDGTLPGRDRLPRRFATLEQAHPPEIRDGLGFRIAGAALGAVVSGGSPWGAVAGWSAARALRTYLAPVSGFGIERVRDGAGPPVLFVDGFLTQGSALADWAAGLDRVFPRLPWYRVRWESQNLLKLGAAVSEAAGTLRLARARPAMLFFEAIRNPWHVALWKAERTGRLLGFLLARTRLPGGCVLIGHSLGARVIFEALQTLGAMGVRRVAAAHLMAAAVDRRGGTPWKLALRSGARIYNYHSRHDGVLRWLYVPGSFFLSDPAGLRPVEAAGVRNVDVCRHVRGHAGYADALDRIVRAR
ncbi:MAG: DUF726 domain-containing protein [Planctomycetes bacterium]|nr:DUF726 domain-containing protein [Planctomycetota bacterium]